MPYKLIVRDKALAEMQDAFDWYEKAVNGLGDKFLQRIEHYNQLISSNPLQFKTTYKNFREVYLRQFPFVLVYFVDEKKKAVVIFSVFHCKKNPKKKFK